MSQTMKRGRKKSPKVTSHDQLGDIKAVAAYMRVSRTWLSGVKRRWLDLQKAKRAPLQSPFAGNKTCAQWVIEFIRLPENSGFAPSSAYRKAPQSQPQGREL